MCIFCKIPVVGLVLKSMALEGFGSKRQCMAPEGDKTPKQEYLSCFVRAQPRESSVRLNTRLPLLGDSMESHE